MMKRMKKEITRLQSELETMKQTKNEMHGMLDIKNKIYERQKQFLWSHSHDITNGASKKYDKDSRRRTWCPSSTVPNVKSLIPLPGT